MMKRVGQHTDTPKVLLKDAAFPSPFVSSLEYSAPARGTWTIVHTGMLIPQAHEIFVCAAGCLRGVVLSAAELNMTDRFSTISIEEPNVLEGDMEELIINGVTDILNRLPKLPPAVLVYSSCIHHFMGSDLMMCYDVLREKFPTVDFIDCYMIPTMRKSGLTPDQIMRKQLYGLIKPREINPKACAILGTSFSQEENSDIRRLCKKAGFTLHEITDKKSYDEYQQMGESAFCITTLPVSKPGGEAYAERMGINHLYLPTCHSYEEIKRHNKTLCDALEIEYDGDIEGETNAETALEKAFSIIGKTPIAIDYTMTPRPVGLARLLVEHGFNVKYLYIDSFVGEEKEDFEALKALAPDIMVMPTVHAAMGSVDRNQFGKVLCLGQKAAYFTDSRNFVNIVEGAGMYGFGGIVSLCDLLIDAYLNEKDTEKEISVKGLGCCG